MSQQAAPDNPCVRAEQKLPSYWQDELSSSDRAWLDQHLQTCAECAELAAICETWANCPRPKPTRCSGGASTRCLPPMVLRLLGCHGAKGGECG